MAARLGAASMAAFQICLQAILACAFVEKDYQKAAKAAVRVLQMGFLLRLGLALVVGLGLKFGTRIFTKDKSVVRIIAIDIPVVVSLISIESLFVLSKTHGFVRNMVCFNHLHGIENICWRLEVRARATELNMEVPSVVLSSLEFGGVIRNQYYKQPEYDEV